METIESKIKALLCGEIKDDEDKEFLNVDYTLEQQNYELSILFYSVVFMIYQCYLLMFIYLD